ncbi:MAG: hypothetical protein H3Z53_01595 [archaeon]|nr:hypothetical protein [archaeon]MCP8313054.1 hypothetical protein [archaeon]MCP8321621.1 hypothetical protein [archaeon]
MSAKTLGNVEVLGPGVLFTPALINNEIVSQGKILKYEEVKKWFVDRVAG